VKHRRLWAALATVWGLVALAQAAAREQPQPATTARAADASVAPPAFDGGHGRSDSGMRPAPLSSDDLEVVENLDLLEHLSESEFLELLEPSRDQ
jgi:hypothetical protein